MNLSAPAGLRPAPTLDPADGAPALPTIAATPTPAPIAVSLVDVEKRFGRFPALKGVSLDIEPGELLALLGPSGSGKTTLLRLIAGLDFPDAGQVRFAGKDVTFAHAAQRGVGFVFQQYALFRHMTVAKNVAFGLDVMARKDRPDGAARRARVEELLALVQLDGLGGRYPSQLSGGQRQRVALARALAVSPKILLLDEPFGALDATVRKSLRRELRRIHQATHVTTVFVTHDQEEALDLADRVALLNSGRIEQLARPAELLDRPASAFVAGFVGQANRIVGDVRRGVFHGPGVELAAGQCADGPAVAFIRSDQLIIDAQSPVGIDVMLERITARGPVLWLECRPPHGGDLLEVALARASGTTPPAAGAIIRLAATGGQVFNHPA